MAVLKKKKRRFWLYGIVGIFLAIVFMWLSSWSGAPLIIPSGSVATYTKDELADLYWAHKDEFSKVVEIVLASDAFRQRITDDHEDDWEIDSEYVKDDFSEEGWNEIVDLFRKIRPYMVMRSLRQGDTVYFNFGPKKTGDMEINTSLYCFSSTATMEAYKSYIWVGTLEQLDGYWYIGEHASER